MLLHVFKVAPLGSHLGAQLEQVSAPTEVARTQTELMPLAPTQCFGNAALTWFLVSSPPCGSISAG